MFYDVNHKLSKYDQLRFGNKGSINVNLNTGQWYDFSTGDGGSLYKVYKEKQLNIIASNDNIKTK